MFFLVMCPGFFPEALRLFILFTFKSPVGRKMKLSQSQGYICNTLFPLRALQIKLNYALVVYIVCFVSDDRITLKYVGSAAFV